MGLDLSGGRFCFDGWSVGWCVLLYCKKNYKKIIWMLKKLQKMFVGMVLIMCVVLNCNMRVVLSCGRFDELC